MLLIFSLTADVQLSLANFILLYANTDILETLRSRLTYSGGLIVAMVAPCRGCSCWIREPNWQPLLWGGRGYTLDYFKFGGNSSLATNSCFKRLSHDSEKRVLPRLIRDFTMIQIQNPDCTTTTIS